MSETYPGRGEGMPEPRPVTRVAGSSPALASDERRLGPVGGRVTAAAYEQHSAEIYAFLLRTVRDADTAADLTADTFTKLLTEEQADRTPLHPRPWLYRVAANFAMSRGRRLQTALRAARELERRAEREDAISPEHAFLGRERDAELHQALGTVSLAERTALLLSAAGYDGPAVASLIGKSHGATRTLLCRARKRLRTELRDRDVIR